MEWRDFVGQEIKVGDVVVYAANADRSAIFKLGIVMALGQTKEPQWNWKTKRRDEHLPTIKCVTVDAWYDRDDDNLYWGANALQKDGKLVSLGHLDRVIVATNIPGAREKFERIKERALKAKEEYAKRLAR